MMVPPTSTISWSIPVDTITFLSNATNQLVGVAGGLASVDMYRSYSIPLHCSIIRCSLLNVPIMSLHRYWHPGYKRCCFSNLFKHPWRPAHLSHSMVDSMPLDVRDHTDVRRCTIHNFRARHHHSHILWNLYWCDNRGCYDNWQNRRPVHANCIHVCIEVFYYIPNLI